MAQLIFVCHDQASVDHCLKKSDDAYILVVGPDPVKRDSARVIVLRDLPYNIEYERTLLTFTAWYAIVKNNLFPDCEYLCIFEWDIRLTEKFNLNNITSDVVSFLYHPNNGCWFSTCVDMDILEGFLELKGLEKYKQEQDWYSTTNHCLKRSVLKEFVDWYYPECITFIKEKHAVKLPWYHERLFWCFLKAKKYNVEMRESILHGFKNSYNRFMKNITTLFLIYTDEDISSFYNGKIIPFKVNKTIYEEAEIFRVLETKHLPDSENIGFITVRDLQKFKNLEEFLETLQKPLSTIQNLTEKTTISDNDTLNRICDYVSFELGVTCSSKSPFSNCWYGPKQIVVDYLPIAKQAFECLDNSPPNITELVSECGPKIFEQLVTYSKVKPLIYFCVFYNKKYIDLLKLILISIKTYSNYDNFTFLVLTSEDFAGEIAELGRKLDLPLKTHKLSITSIFHAAASKCRIFEYPELNEYTHILYLDTDIIIQKDLAPMFSVIEDKLYAVEDGNLSHPGNGGTFYTEEERISLGKTPAINTGVMFFNNSKKMRKTMTDCNNFMLSYEQSGKQMPQCLEQPFINYWFYKESCLDSQSIKNNVFLQGHDEPTKKISDCVMVHFIAPIGNAHNKYERMTKYLTNMISKERNKIENNEINNKVFKWSNYINSFIKFNPDLTLSTLWGKGTYKWLGEKSVCASFGGFDHFLQFDATFYKFLSIRHGDFEIITGVRKDHKPRIYKFLPYYGKFPNYFQLYLDSLGNNADVLTVFIITDIDTQNYRIPPNAIIIQMSKDDIKKRAAQMLKTVFGKTVSPKNLLQDNYKFVDFKVTYPIMFNDILEQYKVIEADFVGWGDCDLIYGKFSNFLDLTQNFHILGGWHGHFAAIRNIKSFKTFFKSVPNFFELCTDNSRTHITDEIACRETLKKFLKENNFHMFFMNAHFCDIVPPCFFHMFRPDHASLEKNFFDVYNSHKNITRLYYEKDGKITVFYDDGSERETIYCHLQKRAMDLPFTDYEKGYYINEHSFSLS